MSCKLKAGILDLFAIKETITLIKNSSAEHKTLVLFNMIKANTTITNSIKKNIEKFNIKIAETMINDRVVYTKSILTKGVATDVKAQKQIDDLTKEILHFLIHFNKNTFI